ncbi:hypothetical protein HMPREF9412_3182 [Paenibacillus sp. HGF5]|nr:hypothetical protein HMPREF9412_3182 [Paenibacillus sp. HGF5]
MYSVFIFNLSYFQNNYTSPALKEVVQKAMQRQKVAYFSNRVNNLCHVSCYSFFSYNGIAI